MNVSRRNFLHLASSGLVWRACSAARGATPAPLRLGFSLYGMKSLPLDRALAECARIGYRTAELAVMPGFPADPAKLGATDRASIVRAARASGLPVVSLLVNLSLAGTDPDQSTHLETLRRCAVLARELDPRSPPVLQTVLGGKPADWPGQREVMAARLRQWSAAAREAGATVADKAHALQAVDTPAKLLELVGAAGGPAPQLALAYDFSHFAVNGLGLEESFRPLAAQVRHVHLKEARREGKEVRFLLPGEGTADFAAQFRLLRVHGYSGPLVVEVSSQIFSRPGYDPIAAAERSYAALAPALRA
jgi:sugar phosphate isomerase/epimerase